MMGEMYLMADAILHLTGQVTRLQAENARLRAGIAKFAAAMNDPDGAWNELTDAQQEAYNALMAL